MTYEEEEDGGRGFRAAAVCFSQSENKKGGAQLKICLSECCLATVLLQPNRTGAGLGSSRGRG